MGGWVAAKECTAGVPGPWQAAAERWWHRRGLCSKPANQLRLRLLLLLLPTVSGAG